MEEINYGNLIDCSDDAKEKAIKTMGEEVANLYIDERNYLLRDKLDRTRKIGVNGEILLHLVKLKKSDDFEVITSGDIARITAQFPGQLVLSCDEPEDAQVTREGRSANTSQAPCIKCMSQKTQGKVLVFFPSVFCLDSAWQNDNFCILILSFCHERIQPPNKDGKIQGRLLGLLIIVTNKSICPVHLNYL
jgi:hypothetical protein